MANTCARTAFKSAATESYADANLAITSAFFASFVFCESDTSLTRNAPIVEIVNDAPMPTQSAINAGLRITTVP